MRLAHIMLKPLEVHDTRVHIEGVIVWQPYGWFARMVLEDVTGPEFGELEDLMRFTCILQFKDGAAQVYDHKQQTAWVEMFDRDHIDGFVCRGALREPTVMLALGRSLFARLESELKKRRAQKR